MMSKTLKTAFTIFLSFALFIIGITASKLTVQSPDAKGYRVPDWGQDIIQRLIQQSVNITGWDSAYLMHEVEMQNAGCDNARDWLKGWKDLTGSCLSTIDSGYIGCVGAADFPDSLAQGAGTPSPGEMVELGKKIIDGWIRGKMFDDPDVNWIRTEEEVYIACYINPFCENFNGDPDPMDTDSIQKIFVLACNLGSNKPPSMIAEYDPEADFYQEELGNPGFDMP